MARPGGPGGFHRTGFLTEEEKKNRPQVTSALLRRIFSYLRPYWKQMLLALLCITVSSWFALIPSILTGRMIDEGLIGRNLSALVRLIILSLILMLLSNLIGVAQSYLNTWISQHITFDMRNQMFRHLQRMSHRFFTTVSQGEIITRMTSDIDGVESVFANTFTSILSNIITLIAALIAMFSKNWVLALIGIVIVPLFSLPTRLAGKTRWKLARQAQEANDGINSILNETLSVSGQMLVKLFNKEDYEYQRYEDMNRQMIGLNIRERMAGRWFFVVISTVSNIGPMLIYLAGGILMMRCDSSLTVGDITVLVALLGKMYGPVNSLLNIQVDWIRSMAMFTRIFEYFDMKPEIEDPACPEQPAADDGSVRFEHVDFSYESSRPILKDVSFEVKSGQCIALVGPSGAGKSTIVSLIPRLFDVCGGCVYFEGIDVRRQSLKSLRERIGVVSQETYLFNGTIRENLLYANPDASPGQLDQACKKANIYDFIMSQPEGYDAIVGNRGLKLSGGEKQRLSIARILLKNPSLLIFDEATSSLDSISENLIQEAIGPLIAARTSILIAHRLSTVLAADEILVVEDGQIVQRGTHDELLRAGGLYGMLYETQFRKNVTNKST